jgi:hypothetical protein
VSLEGCNIRRVIERVKVGRVVVRRGLGVTTKSRRVVERVKQAFRCRGTLLGVSLTGYNARRVVEGVLK